MTTTDKRATAILNWLTNDISLDVRSFEMASSDASFRRYFRLHDAQESYIVMDAPPDKEAITPFINVAMLLKKAGVNVPTIYHQNVPQGFLVLTDFGSTCLLDQLDNENADERYQLALDELFKLQSTVIATYPTPLPYYDKALLTNELSLFYDWFTQQLMGKTIPVPLQHDLNTLLIDSALEQPQVCVHRDYHSRNLMVVDSTSLGVIDFQDAVIGAITYDLVSLLRDCYIAWPPERLEGWLKSYYQRLVDDEMLKVSFDTFQRWFDLMGLQRHLKVLGIFSRLYLRDNKASYLADIPQTMAYVEQICQRYSELTEFYRWLNHEILPTYQQKL
ncbi:MAG: phosphotransferase [Methylococcales bacterium]|nr:phosphotransferase [Methylococcales bacterium]